MKKMLAILMAVMMAAGAAWAQDSGKKPLTQGQLAEILVKALGMVSALPQAAGDQQRFEILTQNGISPEGGWVASAVVTKKDLVTVLVQALGAENEVVNIEDPAAWQAVLEDHGIDMGSLNNIETVLEMEALPSVVSTDYGETSVDPLLSDESPARVTDSYTTQRQEVKWTTPLPSEAAAKIISQVTDSTATDSSTGGKPRPTPH